MKTLLEVCWHYCIIKSVIQRSAALKNCIFVRVQQFQTPTPSMYICATEFG
jgi:hypothetical protein